MRGEKTRDCLWIVLAAAVPALLLRPFQNTPYSDDFVYAWSVETLLQQGQIKILEYSSNLNVTQILWGTLFCLPFGFSFTALRISTWPLAVSSLCGLYLTLRELDVPRRDALLGTAALAFYPVFFLLDVTFMTDVPCLACMVWASFAMVRAQRAQSTGWLLASALLACLAIGIRFVAAVIPLAMLLALLLDRRNWGRERGRFLIALIPVAFLGFLLWWYPDHIQHNDPSGNLNMSSYRSEELREDGIRLLPARLVSTLGYVAGAVGLALLPWSLASVQKRILAPAAVICAALALIVSVRLLMSAGLREEVEYRLPLIDDDIWALEELGNTTPLVPGYEESSIPEWLNWTAMAIGFGSFSIFLATQVRFPSLPGRAFVAWSTIGHFLLLALLNIYYDRCTLALIPGAIVLLLAGKTTLRPGVALTLIALFAVIAIVGLRDHLEYNAAVWKAVDELHEMGVRDSEIDGGYPVNGWFQYAHPENANRDDEGNLTIPLITRRGAELRYQISNKIGENQKLVKTIPYKRWLSRSGNIYILDREAQEENEREKEEITSDQ